MKKPECLCDDTKGGHAIDCDLAPQDSWDNFASELRGLYFVGKNKLWTETFFAHLGSSVEKLLATQKEEIYREWKNKIEIAQNKWMPCKEKNCDNKKECETANHYIETIWNPTFKDLLK